MSGLFAQLFFAHVAYRVLTRLRDCLKSIIHCAEVVATKKNENNQEPVAMSLATLLDIDTNRFMPTKVMMLHHVGVNVSSMASWPTFHAEAPPRQAIRFVMF